MANWSFIGIISVLILIIRYSYTQDLQEPGNYQYEMFISLLEQLEDEMFDKTKQKTLFGLNWIRQAA